MLKIRRQDHPIPNKNQAIQHTSSKVWRTLAPDPSLATSFLRCSLSGSPADVGAALGGRGPLPHVVTLPYDDTLQDVDAERGAKHRPVEGDNVNELAGLEGAEPGMDLCR